MTQRMQKGDSGTTDPPGALLKRKTPIPNHTMLASRQQNAINSGKGPIGNVTTDAVPKNFASYCSAANARLHPARRAVVQSSCSFCRTAASVPHP